MHHQSNFTERHTVWKAALLILFDRCIDALELEALELHSLQFPQFPRMQSSQCTEFQLCLESGTKAMWISYITFSQRLKSSSRFYNFNFTTSLSEVSDFSSQPRKIVNKLLFVAWWHTESVLLIPCFSQLKHIKRKLSLWKIIPGAPLFCKGIHPH